MSTRSPAQDDAVANLLPAAPEQCIRAFHAIRQAILEGSTPELPPMGVHGASIALRLDGKILARATGVGDDAIARAISQTRADIERWVSDAADLAGASARRDELRRAVLSLELAGRFIPVNIETFAEADLVLAPGLDGVAVRAGERVEAVFPATAMLSGKTPGDSLAWSLSTILGDASAPLRGVPDGEAGALARKHNLTYYRFHVTHLVQLRPTDQPRFLHRGGRIVPAGSIGREALRDLARSLAEHLCLRTAMDGDRMVFTGTRHPATGRDEPAVASATDQALAALALAEYALWETDRGAANAASGVARDVLVSLAKAAHNGEPEMSDGGACAAWLLGAQALAKFDPDALPLDAGTLAPITLVVVQAFSEEADQWSHDIDPADRALIAYALASGVMGLSDKEGLRTTSQGLRAVRWLFRETPPQELVVHMPWLVRAEIALAGEGDVPSSPALREFRRIVWAHQVPPSDRPEEADHAGGIVFTAAGNPYPTWLSIAPLDAMALLLADERLTDRSETLPELSRLLAAMRFVRQLAFDEDAAYLAADRRKALWGIRASTWDPRQPLRATALALITVCDADRTLARVADRIRK